jgi:hypothetical protein
MRRRLVYADPVLTELVTKPVRAVVAIMELPITARRSLEEVNQLLEVSRRQLEAMQRQTDSALDQAERMNELLSRVVRLTEPIEKAQRGGEYVADGLRRVIFGEPGSDGKSEPEPVDNVERADQVERRVEQATSEAELAAADAERAALEAERAAEVAEEAAEDAGGAEQR